MSVLRVVAAAILFEGKVYSVDPPGRHWNVLQKIAAETGVKVVRGEDQGFLLSDGRFVMRKAAQHVAREAGQIRGERIIGSVLTTEDLW